MTSAAELSAAGDHSTRAHAKLAPSSADRWMRCPGSVRVCADIPNYDSAASRAGTLRHEYLEQLLRAWGSPPDWAAAEPTGLHRSLRLEAQDRYAVDDAMGAARTIMQAHTEHLGTGAHVERWIEVKVKTPVEGWWGTCDYAGWNGKTRTLLIDDAKFGRNRVRPVGNYQLLSYGVGVSSTFLLDPEWVVLTIAQPLHPGVKPWVIEGWAFNALRDHMIKGALIASGPRAELIPGTKQCGWCPARKGCSARRGDILETVGDLPF